MIGRLSFYFLLYTFLVFFGTPTFVLVMQVVALAICGGVILKNRLSGDILFPLWFWVLLLSVALYIAFSMLRGIANAPTTGPIMFREALSFFLTLCIPFIAYAYFRQGILLPAAILHHFAWAAMAFAVVKCLIALVVGLFEIPIPIIILFFQNVFHTSPMVSPLPPIFIRFSTGSDYVVPFALYYWLSDPARGWRSKTAGFLLLMLCLYLSYSRSVWLMTVVALLAWYLTLSRRAAVALLFAGVALSPLAYKFVDFSIIAERFVSTSVEQSDDVRIFQYQALSRDLDGHLLFGHGWATFRVDFVRDEVLPYSYEMQWLALFYQIGIVGVLCTLALIVVVLVPYRYPSKTELGVIVLFLLAILAAFTNPVLLGRAPGTVYAFVAFYGIESARRNKGNNRNAVPLTA